MILHMNLTPGDYQKHWPEMMMRVRESMDAFIHTLNDIPVSENNYLTSKLFYPVYEPIARLSKSMLSFTFDNSDIKDKKIETNIEIITLDTQLDSIMLEVAAGLGETLNEVRGSFTVDKDLSDVEKWLAGLTVEELNEFRDSIARIVHSHASELLDILFRELTAELLSITFRLRPRPVVVENNGVRTMSMSALLKDAEK